MDAGRRFGEVAETYHRLRPGYPRELFVELLAATGLGPGVRALEIGAGTGKATVPLSTLVTELVALEPDPAMAAVARSVLQEASTAAVARVEVGTFEDAQLDGPFDLLVSAQAWHWTDPATRYDRAADLLVPGGWLALLWHVDRVEDGPLTTALLDAHRGLETADDLTSHLLGLGRGIADDAPAHELEASERFGPVLQLRHPTRRVFDAAQFAELLRTVSVYRALPETEREALLDRVAETIRDHGDEIIRTGAIRLYAAPASSSR